MFELHFDEFSKLPYLNLSIERERIIPLRTYFDVEENSYRLSFPIQGRITFFYGFYREGSCFTPKDKMLNDNEFFVEFFDTID